ncbi:MAG: PDZ domain-containing protein [Oligoflexus sp.]|nr:PDZ domain-containing protein [Oligoflexus sp.]
MFIKSVLVAASAVATISNTPAPGTINRGSIKLYNGQVTIQSLKDNGQLKAAGVKEKDVLVSVCGVEVNDFATHGKADSKLQASDSCSITVLRDGEELSLTYNKEK